MAEPPEPGGPDPAGPIEAPENADRLYVARGNDVDPYRPIMSGDVFRGRIETIDEQHDMVMVLSHPCSMRAGAHLRSRLQVAPVSSRGPIAPNNWFGWYKAMLLPELIDGDSFAASFDSNSPVKTDDLPVEDRVACLSEYGVLVLYQRHVRHLTRLEIGIRELEPVTRAVFTEVALQDDWNSALARQRVEDGESLNEVLKDEEEAFDEVMRSNGPSGVPLRDELRDPYLHAGVRRAVALEIQRRLN